jgi:hypothetical protein
MFKVGDLVRNKNSGSVGTIDRVNPPGMPRFVLVRFHDKNGDGLCQYPHQLEKVDEREYSGRM